MVGLSNVLLLALLLGMFSLGACKPSKRDASKPSVLNINIQETKLYLETRKLLPVLYCNDKSGAQTYVGSTAKSPNPNQFSFSLKDRRPLVGEYSCFIEVYSEETDNLKIDYPNEKIIDGIQYRVLYQSNLVKNGFANDKFHFKALFTELTEMNTLFKVSFKLSSLDQKGELVFYCKETAIKKAMFGNNNETYVFNFNESDILAKPEYLTGCILKNLTSEKILPTDLPEKFNYNASNNFIFQVHKAEESLINTTAKYYERFNGKNFRMITTNGNCKYYLEFKKIQNSNVYRESMVKQDGCSKEGFDSDYKEYFIYDSHEQLNGLVDSRRLLFKFDRGEAEPKYSILETSSEGFTKKGGSITKVELLKQIEYGVKYIFAD